MVTAVTALTAFPALVLLSAIAALLISWAGVRWLRTLAPRLGFIDVPNRRSSHQRPTPRAGGLAFVLVVPLVTLTVSYLSGLPLFPGEVALILGGLVVAAVGLADDRMGLPVRLRFTVYLAASAIPMVGGGYLHELQWSGVGTVALGWAGIPITLLWIVGLTNAYNFMDGIDGIAGVQAVVAASAIGLLALWWGNLAITLYAWVLVGAVLGFLYHNWPPARIFMGDVGSAFLGYSFAGLAVLSNEESNHQLPWLLWVVLLAPFIFDTVLTLARRIIRGERWFEAHRQHLYQRLVHRGWSHLSVTSVYLCADLFLAGTVVIQQLHRLEGVLPTLLALLPLVGILGLVTWTERRPVANELEGPIRN